MVSTVMPANSTTAMNPIIVKVIAAFWAFGRSKGGTPLLIASTPVNAVHPDAKARTTNTSRARPAIPVVCGIGSAAVEACGSPDVIASNPAH